MSHIGKALIIAGIALIGVGLLVIFGGRVPFLGRLPGDFRFRVGETTIYLPLATCILLSIVISVLLTLVFWLFGKPSS